MLTKRQIESIRTNICNRGIETIDLEIEMLDHISSAVEEKMTKGKSFRDSYKSVMLDFGPYGMHRLQQKKYKSLLKDGIKRIGRKYLELLTPPQIIASLSISLIIYITFYYFTSDMLFESASFGSIIIYLFSILYIKVKTFKNKYSQIQSYDNILTLSYFFFYVPLTNVLINTPEFNTLGKTFMIMIPNLYFYSYLSVISKLYKELEENYKSYVLVK